jgi:hypothetical protein
MSPSQSVISHIHHPLFDTIIFISVIGSRVCHVTMCFTHHVHHFLSLNSFSLPGTLLVRGFQISSLLILCLVYFILVTNSVPMSAKSNVNAKRPRVSTYFGNKIENYC